MSHVHWRIIGLSWWLATTLPKQRLFARGAQSGQKQPGSSTLTVSSLQMGAAGRETWLPCEWYKDIHRRRLIEDQEGAAAGGWPLTTPHVRFPWKEFWAATSSIFFLKRPWKYLFYSSSSFQASLTPMISTCSGQTGSMATLRWGNGNTHREVIYPRSPQNDRSRTKMKVLKFEAQCSLLGFKSP